MKGFGNEFEIKKQNTKTRINKNREKIINQAFLLHSQGKIKDALKHYKYCIQEGINDDRIYSNCGLILKSSGNLKQAEELLRKAISINPNSETSYTNLGTILKDLKKFSEAELCCRKAIAFCVAISVSSVLKNGTRSL